jgi:phosphoribosylglycinamide formyltransferase-1
MSAKLRLGVLVSGRGTNLQSILDGCASGSIPAQVNVVVSNRPDVPALKRAESFGVSVACVNYKTYGKWPESKPAYEADLVAVLRRHDVELIVCAGYDRLTGETLLDASPAASSTSTRLSCLRSPGSTRKGTRLPTA